MTFGERVRELRRALRMSQKELAASADIDFTYLSKIENAHRRPPRERVIRAMAEALHTDFLELMRLAGKVPSPQPRESDRREATTSGVR